MRVNPAALRVIRERSGLTVTMLADAAGIGQSHLSNIEAGRRQVSEPVALKLAQGLKCPLVAILWDETPTG